MTLLVIGVISCGQGEPEPPSVEIVAPEEGAVLPDGNVRVVLRARAVQIAPVAAEREGTAHHHLFIDRDITPLSDTIPAGVLGILHLGGGETEFVLEELEPGAHRVIAVLADRSHVPLSPPAADTVHFTVER
ncbi:MAG: DUF4399 domain-containing protein [Gemmatimonadota bacterium]|nr:MAG: DUF4399 domain-containing protein [Gemmatimonadota bacterium]